MGDAIVCSALERHPTADPPGASLLLQVNEDVAAEVRATMIGLVVVAEWTVEALDGGHRIYRDLLAAC